MLLPVHDEIIAMVPEDQGDAATAALVNCMQTEFRGVPIVAEADPPASAGLTLPEPGPETSPSPGYTAPLGRSPGHRRGLGRGSSPMDIDDDAHTIGRCVRHIRYARGESLRVVAELAGISKSHLQRIERGERSLDSRSQIVVLANALQVAHLS